MSKLVTVLDLYQLIMIKKKEVLSKAECEVFFREEVRAWLDENGSALFGTGMPIPKLVRTDVKSSNSTPSKNILINAL